jgi:hypothetical protein
MDESTERATVDGSKSRTTTDCEGADGGCDAGEEDVAANDEAPKCEAGEEDAAANDEVPGRLVDSPADW